MGSKSSVAAVLHRTGLLEVLVVVGIAVVGVLFAAVVALAPWQVPDVGYPPVVHFIPPGVAAPHS